MFDFGYMGSESKPCNAPIRNVFLPSFYPSKIGNNMRYENQNQNDSICIVSLDFLFLTKMGNHYGLGFKQSVNFDAN